MPESSTAIRTKTPDVGTIIKLRDGRYARVIGKQDIMLTIRPYRWRLWGWIISVFKGRLIDHA